MTPISRPSMEMTPRRKSLAVLPGDVGRRLDLFLAGSEDAGNAIRQRPGNLTAGICPEPGTESAQIAAIGAALPRRRQHYPRSRGLVASARWCPIWRIPFAFGQEGRDRYTLRRVLELGLTGAIECKSCRKISQVGVLDLVERYGMTTRKSA